MKQSTLSLSFLAITMLASNALAHAATNIIDNSSFEISRANGTEVGWNAGPNAETLSIDKSTFYHGKNSLHLNLNGNATSFSQVSYTKLQPGTKYTFSAYLRTKSLDPTTGLTIEVMNLGWSFGSQSKLQIYQTTSDWKRYSRTFVVPAASKFKYRGHDNDQYKVMIYAKGTKGEAWVDAIQLEESSSATAYEPIEKATADDGVQDAAANDIKSIGLQQPTYFHIENPLFETLLSDQTGSRHSMYYGYSDLFGDSYRNYALKFGHRYVQNEQYQELLDHHFIPMTNAWARGGVGSYPTMRMILRPKFWEQNLG